MKNKKCIICANKTIKVKINLPTFEHVNLNTISSRSILFKCSNCNMIFTNKKITNNVFLKTKYINSNNDKIIKLNKKNSLTSRSKILSNFIFKKILKKKTNLNILEIGSGKGYLLDQLSKIYKKSNLYGCEIGNYSKFKPYLKKNITFIKEDKLNFIDRSFDLIILSHTINYFQNPSQELNRYKKLLKKDGNLVVIIPDISKNIFYTLMADQKIIPTKISLRNLLFFSGFSTFLMNNTAIPNELICVAKTNPKNNFFLKINDRIVENNLNKIQLIKNKILKLKPKKLFILGTNINSAFVDKILNRKSTNFVDDLYLKKKYFRNKKVINKKYLNKNKILVNAYNEKKIFISNKNKAKIINLF